MIRIIFPEPTDPDWQEWRRECEDAAEGLVELVERGQEPEITDLYKDKRMKLIYKSPGAPFYGKCAYCESDIRVNHPGDIEHWRPKGRVIDENGKPIHVVTADDGTSTVHPGYYWLAYEWRNLLFACEDCNRPSTAKTAGRRIGKRNQFPVRDFRAVRPGEEEYEEPLLINPMDEDPSDHLEMDETGILKAKTDRGQACIDVLGLNARETLVDARRQCVENTADQVRLVSLYVHDNDEGKLRSRLSALKKIKTGAAPFSAAGRVALGRGKESLLRLVGDL